MKGNKGPIQSERELFVITIKQSANQENRKRDYQQKKINNIIQKKKKKISQIKCEFSYMKSFLS